MTDDALPMPTCLVEDAASRYLDSLPQHEGSYSEPLRPMPELSDRAP